MRVRQGGSATALGSRGRATALGSRRRQCWAREEGDGSGFARVSATALGDFGVRVRQGGRATARSEGMRMGRRRVIWDLGAEGPRVSNLWAARPKLARELNKVGREKVCVGAHMFWRQTD